MTYEQYIKETTGNCMKVLRDCSSSELSDLEHLRRILWEDDRVTGVISGFCTSMNGIAEDNIKDILFDEKFLEDFNETELDLETVPDTEEKKLELNTKNLEDYTDNALTFITFNKEGDVTILAIIKG